MLVLTGTNLIEKIEMKKVFQIILAIAIVGLAYMLYEQLMSPLRFQKEVAVRETAVISKIKDIRTAEQAFKQKYQRYTGSFDTLFNFVLNDSLTFERTIGSKDDSVAVAKGLVKTEKFNIAVYDTLFSKRLKKEDINKLSEIPYSNGTKFMLEAGQFETESKVVVPVFECKAPFKTFLADMDQQELANHINNAKIIEKYPGIKVGSMTSATNDAGNWE